MTLNEKVEAVIGNECLLDITPYIGIKGLKKAYIGLAEYDCRTHTYETYCNHYVEKEDLRDYLLKKIPEIDVIANHLVKQAKAMILKLSFLNLKVLMVKIKLLALIAQNGYLFIPINLKKLYRVCGKAFFL